MNMQIFRRLSGDEAVCENPADSFTLPARFYTDPGIYEAEKTAIFYKSWWCAGHKSQLPKPSSYLTTEIHEQGVVVTRDADGALRASTMCASIAAMNWPRGAEKRGVWSARITRGPTISTGRCTPRG